MKKYDYESYAISILQKMQDEYSDMIKGESPDYYSDIIGIEVTRAISNNEGNIDAFVKDNLNKPYSEKDKKRLESLGFKGNPEATTPDFLYRLYSKENGTLLYFKPKYKSELLLCGHLGKIKNDSISAMDIISAVKSKLNKLNKNYILKPRNELIMLIEEQLNYIVCKEEIIDSLFDAVINELKKLYALKEHKIYFDILHLVFVDNLFTINTSDWSVVNFSVSNDILREIYEQTCC